MVLSLHIFPKLTCNLSKLTVLLDSLRLWAKLRSQCFWIKKILLHNSFNSALTPLCVTHSMGFDNQLTPVSCSPAMYECGWYSMGHWIQSVSLVSRHIKREVVPWDDHSLNLLSLAKSLPGHLNCKDGAAWLYEEFDRCVQGSSRSVTAGADPGTVYLSSGLLSSRCALAEPYPTPIPEHRVGQRSAHFHGSCAVLSQHSPASALS